MLPKTKDSKKWICVNCYTNITVDEISPSMNNFGKGFYLYDKASGKYVTCGKCHKEIFIINNNQ